jgi:hypothetical protein
MEVTMYEKEILETASKAIEVSKALMIRDGYLAPALIIYGSNGVITPMSIRMENDQDKNDLAELMLKIVSAGGADALLLLSDSYVVVTDSLRKLTVLPKDHPDKAEAIVAYLHIQEDTKIRYVLYMKKENGGYTFLDTPWEKQAWLTGRFGNPWIKLKNK